jgi:hypothetical protein
VPINKSDARSEQVHFAVAEHPSKAFTHQPPKVPNAETKAETESQAQMTRQAQRRSAGGRKMGPRSLVSMHSSNSSEVQPSQGVPINKSDARSEQVHFAVAEHPSKAFTHQPPKVPNAETKAELRTRAAT